MGPYLLAPEHSKLLLEDRCVRAPTDKSGERARPAEVLVNLHRLGERPFERSWLARNPSPEPASFRMVKDRFSNPLLRGGVRGLRVLFRLSENRPQRGL